MLPNTIWQSLSRRIVKHKSNRRRNRGEKNDIDSYLCIVIHWSSFSAKRKKKVIPTTRRKSFKVDGLIPGLTFFYSTSSALFTCVTFSTALARFLRLPLPHSEAVVRTGLALAGGSKVHRMLVMEPTITALNLFFRHWLPSGGIESFHN